MASELRETGVETALLSAGSSSFLALGAGPDGAGFRVGIRDPSDHGRRYGSVTLANNALGVSGSGEQFFEVDGRRLGHIIDPRSGWPVEGRALVAVTAPTATQADALATAFFVGGPALAESYSERLQQVSLVLLRTFIGWHFLYEGYFKWSLPAWTPDGTPLPAFSSAGFIKASTGPLGSLAHWAAGAGLLPVVDKLIVFGLLAVGLSLMLGLVTRAGCVGAILLLALFYFTAVPTTGLPQDHAEGTYLLVNKTLIEGLAVLALFSFDTGRIAGLDRLWADRRRPRTSPSVAKPA
jgi:thiosulfate dehydrogenase [quinone] large subunit